jgi:hypothetical protein
MIDHGRNKRTPEQHLEHFWFGSGMQHQGSDARDREATDAGGVPIDRGAALGPPGPGDGRVSGTLSSSAIRTNDRIDKLSLARHAIPGASPGRPTSSA